MKFLKNGSLLLNRRMNGILLLSFASSLPLILTGSTLQLWFTDAGLSLISIGALSLIGLPYLLKFLWAPFIDRYTPIPRIGSRRSWILITQLFLSLGLFIMANLKPNQDPWALALIAWIVTFASASQDIAIDAYRVDILRPEERGLGAAVTNLGGRLALFVGGAFAIVLAAKIGWRWTYLLMAMLMFAEMIITLFLPEPKELIKPATLSNAIIQPIKEFLSRPYAIVIIIFIITYKLNDALALALNSAFLIRDVGFNLIEIGMIYKIVSIIALLCGSFIGGFLYKPLGMFRCLLYFGFLQTACNLIFMLLAMVGKNYSLMVIAVFSDYFCGGLSTVAFIAYLISLCNRHYSATQYAIFSALMSIGRVFVGPLAAYLVAKLGWAHFYFATFLIGLPPLLLLVWLRFRTQMPALMSEVN